MKRLIAFPLVGALCLVALGGWATNYEGGSNRDIFCGTGTWF